MVSLTKLFDVWFSGVEAATGIPREQLSAHVGSEVVASILEYVSGLFAKGWLKPVINAVAGGVALGYAVYGAGVPERLRRELMSLGAHLALRALELVRFAEFKRSLESFVTALQQGNVDAALAEVFKAPEDVLSEVFGVGVQAAAEYQVVSPPAEQVAPPPAEQAGAPTAAEYQVVSISELAEAPAAEGAGIQESLLEKPL